MMNKLFLLLLVISLITAMFFSEIIAGPINGVNCPSTSADDPLSTNIAYACGDTGLVIKTTNGGLNWCRMSIPTTQHLFSIYFVNQTIGVVVGGGGVIYYTTNGTTWTASSSGLSTILTSVCFANANTVYAVGQGGKIIKSTDGGITWVALYTDPPAVYLNSVFFVGSMGIVVGDLSSGNPRILRTTNTGVTWTSIANTFLTSLNGVSFLDINTGFAVGNNGLVIKTTDGGLTWASTVSPGVNHFFGVAAFPLNNVIAVGTQGVIFKSTNGGTSWFNTAPPSTKTLYSISLDSAGLTGGYSVGDSSAIFKTTNQGSSWFQQFLSNCYVSVSQTSSTIPEKFSLYQNYPNPFNPVTVISYKLVVSSFTTLKIYDVFGHEISTLVNEELKAGTYKVSWDASNYSSGVYFVKLETPEFTQSRKMLMIK